MRCSQCDIESGKTSENTRLGWDQRLCQYHGATYFEHLMEIGVGDKYCRHDLCSDAIQHYDLALRMFPKSWHAFYQKSRALIRLARLKEAIACLDEWLEAEPGNGGACANKGVALCLLGRHDDAVRCFEAGGTFLRVVEDAYFYQAYSLYMTGRYRGALASCNLMLARVHGHKEAKALRNKCRDALGLKPRWMFWHRSKEQYGWKVRNNSVK